MERRVWFYVDDELYERLVRFAWPNLALRRRNGGINLSKTVEVLVITALDMLQKDEHGDEDE